MENKTLSEQCREYCKVLDKYALTEYNLSIKILEIVRFFDWYIYNIEQYRIEGDILKVYYTGIHRGYSYNDKCFFPVGWLDLDKEEIKKFVEAKKEEEQEQKEQEAERRERQEYERLKAKYDKGE